MPHLYDGIYINLDRSADRRARMEQQFAALGLSGLYRRLPAVDGATLPPRPGATPGERGVFRSHIAAIGLAAESGGPLHVLEDDAVLSPATAPAIDFCIQSSALGSFDIMFTETLVSQDVRALKAFKALFDKATGGGANFDIRRLQIIDLTAVRFACTSSYVVNPKSAERLLDRLKVGWDKGPIQPIDFVLRDEVNNGRLRAACMFPFVTTIDPASIVSSTTGRSAGSADDTASTLVLAVLRHSFFVGRDLAWAHARLAEILARTVDRRPDSHRLLLEKAMGFVLSDHFQAF
ncbi:MAG: glycosyltransferase family 25 protein [Bauldia sp.]